MYYRYIIIKKITNYHVYVINMYFSHNTCYNILIMVFACVEDIFPLDENVNLNV